MRRKILFLVTEDWYFLSHRLCIAAACRDRGWEVVVVTQVNDCREVIEGEGLRVVHLPIRRGGMNLVSELITILRIIFIYLRERPDIVHHVALKPIIYGSFAAKLAGRPIIVNAVAGMGHLFTANRLSVRFVRILVQTLFRYFMRNRKAWLILQNSGDAELFTREGLCPKERLVLIRGSGVDTNQFRPSAEPQGRFVAVIVSRMLKEKGIEEAIEAVRELKSRKLDVLLRLVGDPDPENPSSIQPETLRRWQHEGVAEWLGYRNDVAQIWADAHIAILPSYSEGLPKALLEAAACGRPIITTNIPGCRELVKHQENGLLVPPRDVKALADAIDYLASSPKIRRRMGAAGRAIVERFYTQEKVIDQTLYLYDRAISSAVKSTIS